MATQTVIFATHDPLWLLKFAAAAVLLALPLTIGAHFSQARRTSVAITLLIAFVALMAGHYAALAFLNGWGLLTAIAAASFTLFLGIRYILGTRFFAAIAVALVTVVVLLVSLFIAVVVGPYGGVA